LATKNFERPILLFKRCMFRVGEEQEAERLGIASTIAKYWPIYLPRATLAGQDPWALV
jgi:hypothetical protein